MRLQSLSLLAIALWPFGASLAESTSRPAMSVPSVGVVFDSELHALRRVSGIPGAALLSGAIDAGFSIANAGVARESILVSSASDGSVRLVRVEQNGIAAPIINGAMKAPESIIPSSSGRAAVLSSGGLVQIISGLPDIPATSRQFATGDAGDLTAAAVSDDGRIVLFIAAGNRGTGVWRLNADTGTFDNVLQDAAATVAFRPDSTDAVAVSAAGEIYQLPISGDIRKLALVAESGNAAGIQVSADGARAYVAFSDGVLATIDVGSGMVDRISCRCTPTGLQAMSLSKVFRINDPSSGTLMLLDTSGSEPRTWFVPPDRTPQASPENER
jgi:hypothetical protein